MEKLTSKKIGDLYRKVAKDRPKTMPIAHDALIFPFLEIARFSEGRTVEITDSEGKYIITFEPYV